MIFKTSAGVRLPHAVIKIDESGEIRAKTPALFKRLKYSPIFNIVTLV